MMKVQGFFIAFFLTGFTLLAAAQKPKKIFKDAGKQAIVMIDEIAKARAANSELASPRTLDKGNLKIVASRDWTSGFFPGVLWFLYEYTGDDQWKERARTFTANI